MDINSIVSNAQTTILGIIGTVVLIFAIWQGFMLAIRRNFMAMAGVIVVGALLTFFCYSPNTFKQLATAVGNALFN